MSSSTTSASASGKTPTSTSTSPPPQLATSTTATTAAHQQTASGTAVTPGIAAILEAERQAAVKIEQARQCTIITSLLYTYTYIYITIWVDRVTRLKEARQEAAIELENLKRAKQDEYKRLEQQVQTRFTNW